MQNYWRKEIEKHGGKVANSVIGNPPFAAKNFYVVWPWTVFSAI